MWHQVIIGIWDRQEYNILQLAKNMKHFHDEACDNSWLDFQSWFILAY
jgi:hypothetical protein